MILLDTHIVWWLAYQPTKLSATAVQSILGAEKIPQGIALSSASLYELAWLLAQGRLTVSVGQPDFLEEISNRFLVLPVDGPLAVAAALIPAPFHGDPMDRLIVATAMTTNRTLISADRNILNSDTCKVLW